MNAAGLKDFATYFLTQENRGVSGPLGSSTPAFVESQPSGCQGGSARSSQTAHGKGKGKGPAARRAPGGSGGKRKGSIWCVALYLEQCVPRIKAPCIAASAAGSG
ncbi:unnamed protein product, partial [Ectocarpus sp. 12 AP-2014]